MDTSLSHERPALNRVAIRVAALAIGVCAGASGCEHKLAPEAGSHDSQDGRAMRPPPIFVSETADAPLWSAPVVTCVQLAGDATGRLWFGLSNLGAIDVWNAADGSRVKSVTTMANPAGGMAVAAQEQLVAAVLQVDERAPRFPLTIWNVRTGEVRSCACRADACPRVLGLQGDPLTVWTLETIGSSHRLLRRTANERAEWEAVEMAAQEGEIPPAAVRAATGHVAIARESRRVVVLNRDAEVLDVHQRPVAIAQVAIHLRLPWLATLSTDNAIELWNWETRQAVAELRETPEAIARIAFDVPGRRLAALGDQHVFVWDLTLGYVRQRLSINDATAVASSADGARFAVSSSHGALSAWDTTFPLLTMGNTDWNRYAETLGPEDLQRLPKQSPMDATRAQTPDGRLGICKVSNDAASTSIQEYALVESESNQRLLTYAGSKPMQTVAISPDGELVAFGGPDRSGKGMIQIRHVRTGDPVAECRRLESKSPLLCFAPDSRQIVATSRGLKVWDVATGQLIDTLPSTHVYVLNSLAFSRDGRLLVAGDGQSSFAAFDWSSRDAAFFCIAQGFNPALAPRDLVCDQRFGQWTEPAEAARDSGPAP